MKKADELKVLVMCYWRFNRGCPIVAIEYPWGDSDVMAVTPQGLLIDTEVKVSIHDLNRDRKKIKHLAMERENLLAFGNPADFPYLKLATRVHYFYFAVPSEIKEKAVPVIEEKFPYAGLLVVGNTDRLVDDPRYCSSPPVYVEREPQKFDRDPLNEKKILQIARGMSARLCRIAYELLLKER